MNPSIRRFLVVFSMDLRHNLTRIPTWVWIALLALFAWGFSEGAASIQAGNSQVGGEKAYITSQFALAQQLSILGLLIYGFFTAVVGGMSPVQDRELRVIELLTSTSLRPREYIWGKYLAAVCTFLFVAIVHLTIVCFFNHVLPGRSETADLRGPFELSNYVVPMLVFLLPQLVFIGGASFALGAWTRSPILVFVFPVALLLVCGFFLWEWSPEWLDPSINRTLMLLDPAGLRWLAETWLEVDRGVAFYNHESIPMDTPFLLSRLAFVTIGIGCVAATQWQFSRSLKGSSARKAEVERALSHEQESATPELAMVPDASLASLGMTSRPPGFFAGATRVARVELRELRASAGLYIFIPLILLQTIGISLSAVGAFDTPLLATPGSLAVGSMGTLSILVCLLLLFYTVESILRERHLRLDAILNATPVRTSSLLLGKVVAGATVGTVILGAALVADMIVLLVQGKVAMDLRPFLVVWGLLLVPTFILWCAFVAAMIALTRNRYATYAIGLSVLIFSGYRFLRGEMNWVGNWALWSSVRWSDLSWLEFDRRALVLNRTWALALAGVFTMLTGLWFARRDRDATNIASRFRPRPLLRTALRLAPVVVPTVVLGISLWMAVERGMAGGMREKLQKDYWKQNLATWLDYPIPALEAVDMDVELEPKDSSFRVQGTYRVSNRSEEPLRHILVTAGPHWNDIQWTWNGEKVEPDDRSRLFVFTPKSPLMTGDMATIGFSYHGRFPDGISKNGGGGGEFILPSGVVLTSFGTSFAPVLGYDPTIGVDDENDYESKIYPDDYFEGQVKSAFGSSAMMTTRLKITAPEEYIVNSVGVPISSEAKDGRKSVIWESDEPVHFFNIVAGKWLEKRGEGTVVYYHPTHTYNVDDIVEGLDAARRYYSEWFYPYPWAELKISEFPALASYAQGFPTNITFSEGIGFLTNATEESDVAFMVTAHESAHQWWGNLLLPGDGPGGNILSEGMAHYSTAMLMEEVKGPQARMAFLRNIENSYTRQRNADEERPLVRTDGTLPTDNTVTYDKGGWVFWMLMNHMGRERMLKGLHAFIDKYRVTDDFPLIQDLLATLRPFAEDPGAFDSFTRQWFHETVLPEFRLSNVTLTRTDGGGSTVQTTVKNQGTGQVRVEIAAERGERFPKDSEAKPDYQQSLVSLDLGPGEEKTISISTDFVPERVVVDPDYRVLQLLRNQAKFEF